MVQGKVKWYNKEKGYGFIQGDDGQEYFMHHTQLPRDAKLQPGDKMSFDVTETDRGLQAQNIELLN